jgi:hypothetical protein
LWPAQFCVKLLAPVGALPSFPFQSYDSSPGSTSCG